eukprot:scaffold4238_cov105-Isochrysis_galbana.AAC.12
MTRSRAPSESGHPAPTRAPCRCDCAPARAPVALPCLAGDRSARRHTDFSLVLSGGRLRRRRNGITLSTERCCARARGSERAAPVGAVAARSQAISPTLRSPLEPSQADRHPDQLRN